MEYAKYEFIELPDLLDNIENANIVILGHLVVKEGTYDEYFNEITAPIINDKIAVDVLYQLDILDKLEPNRVYPINPKHFIGGCQELYYKTLKQ